MQCPDDAHERQRVEQQVSLKLGGEQDTADEEQYLARELVRQKAGKGAHDQRADHVRGEDDAHDGFGGVQAVEQVDRQDGHHHEAGDEEQQVRGTNGNKARREQRLFGTKATAHQGSFVLSAKGGKPSRTLRPGNAPAVKGSAARPEAACDDVTCFETEPQGRKKAGTTRHNPA